MCLQVKLKQRRRYHRYHRKPPSAAELDISESFETNLFSYKKFPQFLHLKKNKLDSNDLEMYNLARNGKKFRRLRLFRRRFFTVP